MLLVAAPVLAGCDDPLGIVRIHFSLRPPRVVEFEEDAGPPPVDPFVLPDAAGTVDIFPPEHHLACEMTGLPTPTDPELAYHFWLSDSDRGGGWVLGSEVHPRASGAGSAHLFQDDVRIDLHTVRAAILSLDEHEATGPSHVVILTGAAGLDPDPEEPATGGNGGGGHQH